MGLIHQVAHLLEPDSAPRQLGEQVHAEVLLDRVAGAGADTVSHLRAHPSEGIHVDLAIAQVFGAGHRLGQARFVARAKERRRQVGEVAVPARVRPARDLARLIAPHRHSFPIADQLVAHEPAGPCGLIFDAGNHVADAGIHRPTREPFRQPHERARQARLAEQRQDATLVPQHHGDLIHDPAGGFGDDVLHPLTGLGELNAREVDAVGAHRRLHHRHFDRGGGADALVQRHIRLDVNAAPH